MKKLAEADLRLGYDKCTFLHDNVDILGHNVSRGVYKPLESRI